MYPSIPIGGRLRGGVVTVNVFGSNVGFDNGVDSKIGEVIPEARPLIPVRVLAGIQEGSWILLVINVDGNIYITGKYGGGTVSNLDISATYLAA